MTDELDDLILNEKGCTIVQITEPYYSIDQEIETFRRMIEKKFENSQFHFVKINLSQHQNWAEKFGIYGSPATLIFNDGNLEHRILGRFNPEEILGLTKI